MCGMGPKVPEVPRARENRRVGQRFYSWQPSGEGPDTETAGNRNYRRPRLPDTESATSFSKTTFGLVYGVTFRINANGAWKFRVTNLKQTLGTLNVKGFSASSA